MWQKAERNAERGTRTVRGWVVRRVGGLEGPSGLGGGGWVSESIESVELWVGCGERDRCGRIGAFGTHLLVDSGVCVCVHRDVMVFW